jgi:hypothetical protein
MRPDNEHDQSAIKNGSEHQSHDDLDLEIVSGTFRSIVDQNAFDKLILSWNQ